MINELRTTIGQPWFDIIFSALILFLSVLLGLFLKIVVISRISKMAELTSWKWDDPVVKYLKGSGRRISRPP
ncbi:MAG: hypothetical protein HY762_01585 [Planctomycetes bacterium]|nr:hypothetical protein [Planctomycetota bacterium]